MKNYRNVRIVMMLINKRVLSITLSILLIGLLLIIDYTNKKTYQEFDGQRAYEDVEYQLSLGSRLMNSYAHGKVTDWIISTLEEQHWKVQTQEPALSGQKITNIIAKRGNGSKWVIIGSHYDSRYIADKDPILENRTLPVPGANDGASSTAILLELARDLPKNLNVEVWLVFFDNEDNGIDGGSGWGIGSEYFVSQLTRKPDYVVILDMVGDTDLDVFMEGNSNQELNDEIWNIARQLNYSQFIRRYKYSLIDDHTAFIEAGIKAVDIIDFDYPYWHTTEDTIDKISADSLKVVGQTILTWLENLPEYHVD